MTRPGMAPPATKAKHFWPAAKRLLSVMGNHRSALVAAFTLTVASVGLAVVGPRIIGHAVDAIFSGTISAQLPAGISKTEAVQQLRDHGQGTFADMVNALDLTPGHGIDFTRVGEILLLALAVYVISAVLQYVQGIVLNTAVQRAMYELRRDVAAKINRLPLSYFDSQPRGEMLSRVTNDIDNIGQSLSQALSQLLTSVLTIVGVLVMMFWVSPILTVIALVAIPAAMVLTAVIMKRSQAHFVNQWKFTGALNAQVEESFSGHDLVTVFGRRQEVEQRFSETNDSLMEAGYRAQFISGLVMPIMMFVGNLQYVVVCVVGALRVASGSMTLGDVTAFVQYSRQFTQPITQLASMTNLLQSGVASAERVFEVLDATEEAPDVDASDPVATRGLVEFAHVEFGYGDGPDLITDLNLTALPGQTVAIVGPTGAGKTTLVNLLMRFYPLRGGTISLDGNDIAWASRAQMRAQMGMVLQDTWVFHGTIADNIRYGRLDATDDEVRQAATATFVDRFVQALPDGYDTVIDEDSGSLSAGERQLITIARAFLADPAVLILDEATSSVDTRTEVLLQDAMAALKLTSNGTPRTSFVIAHRLSTIRNADIIVVMEHGAIVEQGNHESLMAAQGAYYQLYQTQLAAVDS